MIHVESTHPKVTTSTLQTFVTLTLQTHFYTNFYQNLYKTYISLLYLETRLISSYLNRLKFILPQ